MSGEIGPVYGVDLDAVPLGTGGMKQALPRRSELDRVMKVSERTVAAYEVLLGHYVNQSEEIKRLDLANHHLAEMVKEQQVEIERLRELNVGGDV